MTTTVVAGNPKPDSRTLDAGVLLSTELTGRAPDTVIDVITLGPGLLGWGDAAVSEAVRVVGASDLVVVASPTFKATYSGVLKLFLDQFAGGEGLRGVVAVALMLGAGPAHTLACELTLKPVLTELGASTPAAGLYLREDSYRTDGVIAEYVQRWGSALRGHSAPGDKVAGSGDSTSGGTVEV